MEGERAYEDIATTYTNKYGEYSFDVRTMVFDKGANWLTPYEFRIQVDSEVGLDWLFYDETDDSDIIRQIRSGYHNGYENFTGITRSVEFDILEDDDRETLDAGYRLRYYDDRTLIYGYTWLDIWRNNRIDRSDIMYEDVKVVLYRQDLDGAWKAFRTTYTDSNGYYEFSVPVFDYDSEQLEQYTYAVVVYRPNGDYFVVTDFYGDRSIDNHIYDWRVLWNEISTDLVLEVEPDYYTGISEEFVTDGTDMQVNGGWRYYNTTTDPIEPTEPIEPIEPTDPIDPTDPTDPTDPENPPIPNIPQTGNPMDLVEVSTFQFRESHREFTFTPRNSYYIIPEDVKGVKDSKDEKKETDENK